MTTAQEISAIFNDDGMCWENNHQDELWHMCYERAETSRVAEGWRDVFEFADGSAIVTGPSCWDIRAEGCEMDCYAGIGCTCQESMDKLAEFMQNGLRERLHRKLAPCAPAVYWRAYVEAVGEEKAAEIETLAGCKVVAS